LHRNQHKNTKKEFLHISCLTMGEGMNFIRSGHPAVNPPIVLN
jgi:hypothetical protein